MRTKQIKVTYTTRHKDYRYTRVPKLQLEGSWLEELGFTIGAPAQVEYEEGVITIRLKQDI